MDTMMTMNSDQDMIHPMTSDKTRCRPQRQCGLTQFKGPCSPLHGPIKPVIPQVPPGPPLLPGRQPPNASTTPNASHQMNSRTLKHDKASGRLGQPRDVGHETSSMMTHGDEQLPNRVPVENKTKTISPLPINLKYKSICMLLAIRA